MGLTPSRFVEIQISNQTPNITLDEPRTFFYSGRIVAAPQPSLAPGSSGTYRFSNNTVFYGCNGILAFNSEAFTLAICFSNPIDYNRFSHEVALEVSLDKVHKTDLGAAYKRLVSIAYSPDTNTSAPVTFLTEHQYRIQLNTDPVKVTATVYRGRTTFIQVVMEDWGKLREKPLESPCESCRPPQETPLRYLENPTDASRNLLEPLEYL